MDNLAKSGDVQAAKTIFSEMSGKGVKIGKFFKTEEKQTKLFFGSHLIYHLLLVM